MATYEDLLKLTKVTPGQRVSRSLGELGASLQGKTYSAPEDDKNTVKLLQEIMLKEMEAEQTSKAEELKHQRAMELEKTKIDLEKQKEGELMESILGRGGQSPRLKSIKVGGQTFEMPKSEEERQAELSQEVEKQGLIAAEKERRSNLGKVKRLRPIADIVEKKWKETKPGSGGEGRFAGLGSILTSEFQSNEQQQIDAAYRKFVRGMRAQLARAMGDVGNLSVPEQQAAMELVPGLGDNLETGKRKIQTIRDFITAIESGNVEGAKSVLQTNTPGIPMPPSMNNEREQAKQLLIQKGYSEQEIEQLLGQ